MGVSKYKDYFQDAFYHIYNRGNNKQYIFREPRDYLFYLFRIEQLISKHQVSLVAYVLMPNHIHLVVRQDSKIPIYKFISSLHTSYSMYFNKKYKHIGHLFQGRFQQKIIKTIQDLAYVSSYVHLNPELGGLVTKLDEYIWSSYPVYVSKVSGNFCSVEFIQEYFGLSGAKFIKAYKEFILDMKKPIQEYKALKKLLEVE